MKWDAIDWQIIINQLQEFCSSEKVRDSVDQLPCFESTKQIAGEFDKVDNFRLLLLNNPRPSMESLDLYFSWSTRLEKNAVLKPIELKDLRHFCLDVLTVKEILDTAETKINEGYKNLLLNPEEPLSAIDQIIHSDGNIRSDASEKLFQLFTEKNNLNKTISNTLDQIVKKNELEGVVQDKYVTTREGRRVVPIKSNLQSRFDGIIHASSHSNKTVFMEPEVVVPLNNRLRQIEIDIEEEIQHLLRQLSQYLFTLKDDFSVAGEVLETVDLLYAKAQLAQALKANPCSFSQDTIDLIQVRHPGLILQNEKVVANSISLNSENRILLLTGPNAGGKTVLLKSIGLAAMMAKHGLFICAELGSKLPLVEGFHIAVGDMQSVDENMSTFAGHLQVLNEALGAKGTQQLILVDEICGSTDPEEGSALAKSFILEYLSNQCFAVITSHLSPLKSGWEENCGLVNGSLEYNSQTGRPSYEFLMGIPGESLAIQTAQSAGVSQNIIHRALELLSPERRRHQKSAMEVDSLKEDLLKMREQLTQQMRSAEKQKTKYEKMQREFEKEKQQKLESELSKAKKNVETLIEQAKVDKTFKKHETLQKIKTQLPQVITAKDKNLQEQNLTADDFTKVYPKGSKVYIESVGRDGIVQSEPNSRGEVDVLSQSMQLKVSWEALQPPRTAQDNRKNILQQSNKNVSYSPADSDRVVDIRGLSVEEAIEQLELQLDTAAVQDEDRVKIIHGHGTDTLKRSVRQYLSRSIYVKKWQAGNKLTGGDGVTWIEIN